jgi:hypothetical protein
VRWTDGRWNLPDEASSCLVGALVGRILLDLENIPDVNHRVMRTWPLAFALLGTASSTTLYAASAARPDGGFADEALSGGPDDGVTACGSP